MKNYSHKNVTSVVNIMKKHKMIKWSKQKKKCIICGEYYKHLQIQISSQKHRKALLNDTGNKEIKEYETVYKSRLRSHRINNCNNFNPF